MKINAISITNSILKGVTLPEKPKFHTHAFTDNSDCWVCGLTQADWKKRKPQHDDIILKEWEQAYNSALQQGIEFEKPEQIKLILLDEAQENGTHNGKIKVNSTGVYPTDGIYPLVEPIECEVQTQVRNIHKVEGWDWMDVKLVSLSPYAKEFYEFRDVLVICEVKEEKYKCQDCGVEVNEGEFKTFGVCDNCWDKAYSKVEVKEEKQREWNDDFIWGLTKHSDHSSWGFRFQGAKKAIEILPLKLSYKKWEWNKGVHITDASEWHQYMYKEVKKIIQEGPAFNEYWVNFLDGGELIIDALKVKEQPVKPSITEKALNMPRVKLGVPYGDLGNSDHSYTEGWEVSKPEREETQEQLFDSILAKVEAGFTSDELMQEFTISRKQ